MISYSPDSFPDNTPITLSFEENGQAPHFEKYQINPQHRDGTPIKSQWLVSKRDEVKLFGWAVEHESRSGDYYWGVIQHNNICKDLGITAAKHLTKIARFAHSNKPVLWHGYPVDYIQDPLHDCPHKDLLTVWRDMGIIEKQQIKKLQRGQGWKD